jgi:2-polyprenyl-3-methyl-5-hydroxy-6-metoxy-1,4-benzoquinol methylase
MPLSWMAVPAKAVVNRFPVLNAAIWDIQYRLGLWNELDSANGSQVVTLLEKYTVQPNILDLGCGKGVNLHLTAGKYSHYHGVDISAASIKLARKHARPQMSFEAADILRYETDERYDAVLLREVVYYLPVERIPGFLHRVAGFLRPDGKVFVQFWDKHTCAEYVDLVLNAGLRLLEERVNVSADGPESVVVVLQSAASAAHGRGTDIIEPQ